MKGLVHIEKENMLQNLIGKKLKTFKLKSRTMGQGVTGVVVEGVDLRNNQPVAVKIMYFNASTYQEVKKKAVTEISILTMIHNNDNVVKYVDSFETDQLIFIVTDLCNGGDLHEYLLSHEPEEEEAVVMLKHILNGFKVISCIYCRDCTRLVLCTETSRLLIFCSTTESARLLTLASPKMLALVTWPEVAWEHHLLMHLK